MSIRTTIVDPGNGDWGAYIIENDALDDQYAKWTYGIYSDTYKCTAMKNVALRTYHDEDTVSSLPKWLVVA